MPNPSELDRTCIEKCENICTSDPTCIRKCQNVPTSAGHGHETTKNAHVVVERCCPHHCTAPDCDCMRGRGKMEWHGKDNRSLESLIRDEQEAMRKKREASNETA